MTALPMGAPAQQPTPSHYRLARDRYLWFAVLGGGWLFLWYLFPIIEMLWRFAFEGEFVNVFALSPLEQTLYLRVYLNTFVVAIVVTVECLLLGYIAAYALYVTPERYVGVLISLVLIPFWISVIVRTYALLVVLGRTGVVNQTLLGVGAIDAPLRIMFTTEAVYIGMAQALLPFMVLCIYSALKGIDPSLPLAARAAGANAMQVFLRIILPLSLPGVWGGSLLVFILALGYFITPALLGGPRNVMIAQLIHQQATLQGNFGVAILLSIPLLAITLILVGVFNRYMGLDRIWGGRG